MRTVKAADVRKSEILDAAGALFNQKGYDATTISDIINKLGVARGLVYYHFKSKEEILDALIERTGTEFLAAAKRIAEDKSIPVFERLFQTLLAMNAKGNDEEIEATAEQMHKPQNALMHQKSHMLMMAGIPPILMEIISDGIAEGLFDTPYPYESLEMIVAHVNTVFDSCVDLYSPEELLVRINAFIFNIERLLGAASGSFEPIKRMFATADNNYDTRAGTENKGD